MLFDRICILCCLVWFYGCDCRMMGFCLFDGWIIMLMFWTLVRGSGFCLWCDWLMVIVFWFCCDCFVFDISSLLCCVLGRLGVFFVGWSRFSFAGFIIIFCHFFVVAVPFCFGLITSVHYGVGFWSYFECKDIFAGPWLCMNLHLLLPVWFPWA